MRNFIGVYMSELENQNPQISSADDDEISLIDLLAVLWHFRVLILGVTCAAAVIVFLVSFISIKLPSDKSYWPNTYTSTEIVQVTDFTQLEHMTEKTTIANTSMVVFVSKSNPLYDAIAEKFDFATRYPVTGEKKKSTYREMVKDALKAEYSKDIRMLTVSYTSTDKELAQQVAHYAVEWIESYLFKNFMNQVREVENEISVDITESESLMSSAKDLLSLYEKGSQVYAAAELDYTENRLKYTTALASKKSLDKLMENPPVALEMFQLAEVPDTKTGPSRGKPCIIVVAAAFFISVFIAFLINAIQNIMADPVAMAKFKDTKKE